MNEFSGRECENGSAPPELTVVAPVYNESENLPEFHRRVAAALREAGAGAGGPLYLCFLACLAFAVAVSVRFYAEQWNGFDDGAYVHIADRLLQGEVLHRDVQDIHLGYINFINAGAMWLFGNDAVSLRYPLVAMGVLSGALAFWLAANAGPACAAAASVAMTCLSYVQFMNPTANWYCLFVCLLVLAVMKWTPPAAPLRHVLLGLLVGVGIFLRQISGVFIAAAVLLYLFAELPPHAGTGRGLRHSLRHTWLGRAVLVVAALGLGAYTLRHAGVVAFLLYGVWPLALLAWGVRHGAGDNGAASRMLLRFSAGMFAAALPVVAYHVYHGSVGAWVDDAVVTAVGFSRTSGFRGPYYSEEFGSSVRALVRPKGVPQFLGGAFWALALLLPTLVGAAAARALWNARVPSAPATDPGAAAPPRVVLTPLTVLAVFYFLAALHLQKWMYFFFAAPLTFVALAAMLPAAKPAVRRAGVGVILGLSLVALVLFPAPFRSILPALQPLVPPWEHRLPRCGIWLEPGRVESYREIMALVDREVAPGEPILALPASPELYYLTGRRNPTRFSYAVLGLRSREDVGRLAHQFEQTPPRLVFYTPKKNFDSNNTRELMAWVADRYEKLGEYGPYHVYRSRAPGAPGNCRALPHAGVPAPPVAPPAEGL